MTAAPVDVLTFECAGLRYALPVDDVVEVLRACALEPLAGAPGVVSGVINMRGQVVPVIDMRVRLGLTPKAIAPEDYFIVARASNWRLALHVDQVHDLVRVVPTPVEHVAPLPDFRRRYLTGVAPTVDGTLLVQSLHSFLSFQEERALHTALSGK